MIKLVEKRLQAILSQKIEGTITASEKKEFGHYTSNVAFRLSKQLKKPPLDVAKDLAVKLSKVKDFEKVEAVAPGFINFWVSSDILQKEIQNILKSKKSFGKLRTRKSKKINVEFVSANPTGPLTMANGRGGFYGDVLSNVLENVGHKVTREYYINDTGNQVFLLGLSILNKAAPNKVEEILKKYKLADEIKLYLGAYINELSNLFGAGRISEADPRKIGQRAAKHLLKDIKKSLKKAGINHDVWFSEDKNLHKKKELDKTLAILNKKGLVKEKDGAKWFKDNVLVKSDGNPTYFLADLAYHYDKLIKRKFDLAIDIWGADHHGYIKRMKTGVEALGIPPERLQILITQMIRLVRGGKEVRMSKRKGEFVTMNDLLDEVGVDAARFFFLMHSADTHMDFDLDLAKEKSKNNPVYYTQYAYVRCVNILKRANKRPTAYDLRLLNSEPETRLMLELVKFPDIISQTAEDYQVHRLTKYAGELAKALHYFYEKEKVIAVPPKRSEPRLKNERGEEKEIEKARLALVSATKIVLENLFDVLEISKPKKM